MEFSTCSLKGHLPSTLSPQTCVTSLFRKCEPSQEKHCIWGTRDLDFSHRGCGGEQVCASAFQALSKHTLPAVMTGC